MVRTGELSPEQVYNMDETGLNIKMLPETTFLGSHEQSASSFKKNKERITVAVCSNAAGTHKIPLFVIGKSAKPRAFKNLNPSSLSVYYKSQKSAWMNSDLFKEWFNLETEEEENKSTLQDLQKLSGNESLQAEDVENWMINCDEYLENEFLNNDEIIDLANKEQEEDDESSDVEEEKTVSHEEAKNVMEIALKYIEQQHESTALDVLVIRKWRDVAFRNSLKVKKQKKSQTFSKNNYYTYILLM